MVIFIQLLQSSFLSKSIFGDVNPSYAEATFVQSTRCKDLRKSSKPCHVGIHWIALTGYSQMSMPGFQSFLSYFASFYIGKSSHPRPQKKMIIKFLDPPPPPLKKKIISRFVDPPPPPPPPNVGHCPPHTGHLCYQLCGLLLQVHSPRLELAVMKWHKCLSAGAPPMRAGKNLTTTGNPRKVRPPQQFGSL